MSSRLVPTPFGERMTAVFICVTGGQLFTVDRNGKHRHIGTASTANVRLAVKQFRPYAIVRPK